MQFNQQNNNIGGDVNNAISGKGNVVQSFGDQNKIGVDTPKDNFLSMLWKKIKAVWKLVFGGGT